ncbi:MAG: hypothetical protein LUH48_03315, partial [Clostridiales bacterium]|nr:hypothetical protein [Clostridiales bacterium]
RDTEIYYNQSNAPMLIRTNDPKLIRKLNALAADFPELCKLTEEDEICGAYFEVDKKRVSIHVTRPYSEERRQRQSQWAKENGLTGNQERATKISEVPD